MPFSSLRILRTLGLLAAAFGVSAAAGRAELVINPGDIRDGRYIYRLERADMQPFEPESGKIPDWDWTPVGNKFFDDVHSFSNLRMTAGHWSFIQMRPGARSAEFVYRFDFSRTGRRPTTMRLREVVRHEQDGPAHDRRAETAFASFYRFGDDGEWIPLHASEPGKGFRGDKVELSPPVPIDGQSLVIYYKVIFTADRPIHGQYLRRGDPAGHQGRGGPLWNLTRADQPDNFFQVVFQTEPARVR